ncbi:hemolysin family protein [Phenylobacterium aquaticum]|jgi:CBS domain containing-hemolysin-like protein|uniref:hemolysin family protein n=1 Tax=Phenylobacterium aquaticum TaxID=1763816 RepID=UPI001F5D3501|nr:hemolysin family protein [Phenylobacterium aquaticum]MCI3135550.1 hemolysin family protein [Phenylobacterium aquaticum]
MASSDEPNPGARPSRGLRAFLRRLRSRSGPDAPLPVAAPGGQLVDQAQAFQTLRVDDVMTPRADIVAVELSTPFSELVERLLEAEHSRMPIYRETLDDPVGVVHVKDVFKLMATPAKGKAKPLAPTDTVLQKLRRDALYVPASMRAADLLLRMQGSRIHMALVIDEFGGTDGLVTLEDLVEAVVGEIDDEHDEAQAAGIIARPGGVYEVEGRTPLEELEAAVGAALAAADLEEEIDTVAGLVIAIAGRVPQRGEVITHPDGFEFQVIDADPRRVKRVRLRPTVVAPPPETAA